MKNLPFDRLKIKIKAQVNHVSQNKAKSKHFQSPLYASKQGKIQCNMML
jgi:hypothetical protein